MHHMILSQMIQLMDVDDKNPEVFQIFPFFKKNPPGFFILLWSHLLSYALFQQQSFKELIKAAYTCFLSYLCTATKVFSCTKLKLKKPNFFFCIIATISRFSFKTACCGTKHQALKLIYSLQDIVQSASVLSFLPVGSTNYL